MNTQPHADDELLSSYIDGEATPDEVARIEADPALMVRVAALRAARNLMATPVDPLGDGDIDRLIDRALAASETSTAITDLGAARARRADPRRTIIAVAAAVVMIAIAVPVLTYAIDTDGRSSESADEGSANDTATATRGDDTASADDTSADDTDGGDDDRAFETAGVPAEADDAADDDAEGVLGDANDSTAIESALDGAGFLSGIDAVTNTAELSVAARAAYNEYRRDAGSSLTAEESLDDFQQPACIEAIQAVLAGQEPAVIDIDVLAVAGTARVVAALELDAGEIILVVTPLADCEPVEILSF